MDSGAGQLDSGAEQWESGAKLGRGQNGDKMDKMLGQQALVVIVNICHDDLKCPAVTGIQEP